MTSLGVVFAEGAAGVAVALIGILTGLAGLVVKLYEVQAAKAKAEVASRKGRSRHDYDTDSGGLTSLTPQTAWFIAIGGGVLCFSFVCLGFVLFLHRIKPDPGKGREAAKKEAFPDDKKHLPPNMGKNEPRPSEPEKRPSRQNGGEEAKAVNPVSKTIGLPQRLTSWDKRITIMLESIDFQPDNTMRWHFSFLNNKGENEEFYLGFKGEVYVTDQNGDRCGRLTTSAGIASAVTLSSTSAPF